MVAPHLLRNASFFAFLSAAQQKSIARNSQVRIYPGGADIFRQKDRAADL